MRGRGEWAEVFGRAPIGVLVLGFLLLLVGAGLILGGAFFALTGEARAWPVWAVMFGTGPLAIYLALQFVGGRGWAWIAVCAMLVMTAVTSAFRTWSTEAFPVVPLVEIVISLTVLAYLARPSVRRSFDR